VTLSILIAFAVSSSGGSSVEHQQYLYGISCACFLSCLIFALMAKNCTTPVKETVTPCFFQSRQILNFFWLGVILIIYGALSSQVKQFSDGDLEKYVVLRQLKTHQKVKDRPDYDTNPMYNSHKQTTNRAEEMLEASNKIDLLETGGLAVGLQPVRVPVFGTKSPVLSKVATSVGAVLIFSVLVWSMSAEECK